MFMKVYTFEVNPFRQNTYLVINENKGILFDAGFQLASELSVLKEVLEKESAVLHSVYLTHAHIDHVFGAQQIRDLYGVPFYMHPDDQYFWDNFMATGSMYGFQVMPFDFEPEPLTDTTIDVAGLHINVLFTPGHAPGHCAFYFGDEKMLISGDALFRESIGRTDLRMGDFDQLSKSIRTQLYVLPDDTVVLPGHGPSTTIGHEKLNNPFVRA